jgi:hypothetical protein
MTIRAEKIVNATLELTLRPKSEDRKKVVACVLREVVDLLQYDQSCWDEPVEHMVLDARAILDVADEVEAL